MKHGLVVQAAVHIVQKVPHRARRILRVELKRDVAQRCLNLHDGVQRVDRRAHGFLKGEHGGAERRNEVDRQMGIGAVATGRPLLARRGSRLNVRSSMEHRTFLPSS